MQNLSTPRLRFLIWGSRVGLFISLFILVGAFLNNYLLAVEKIDINTASAKELQKITGVGPVLAQRIIEARPFYSLEELTRVKGIGPRILEKIKKEGLAWIDPKLKPPKIENIESSGKELAVIAEPLRQGYLEETQKSLSVFLIALVLAIFSGTIILTLKNKLKKGL